VANLLFLSQRLPYPPNKGEKIRAWHQLRHLARQFDVHLGCLVDDPADMAHVPAVAAICRDVHAVPIDPRRARLACLGGLLSGEGLSVTYFRQRSLAGWVHRVLDRVRPEVVFVYSSNMAPYVLHMPRHFRLIVDLVDVDSEKWRQLAATARQPMRAVYRREWRRIAALEERIVRDSDHAVLVSEPEADLLRRRVPANADRVCAIANGVDTRYFDPTDLLGPDPAGPPEFVFTGTMDYPPNEDAVAWFAGAILPLVRAALPRARFTIVGANPGPRTRRLAAIEGVTVTGRVADVRPYLARATAAVAPMRIARGIQNKVLEAMAMARPVVVTSDALEGIAATPGQEVLLADSAEAFAAACIATAAEQTALAPVLPASALGTAPRDIPGDTTGNTRWSIPGTAPDNTSGNTRTDTERYPGDTAAVIGQAARRRIVSDYDWDARLAGYDTMLSSAATGIATP